MPLCQIICPAFSTLFGWLFARLRGMSSPQQPNRKIDASASLWSILFPTRMILRCCSSLAASREVNFFGFVRLPVIFACLAGKKSKSIVAKPVVVVAFLHLTESGFVTALATNCTLCWQLVKGNFSNLPAPQSSRRMRPRSNRESFIFWGPERRRQRVRHPIFNFFFFIFFFELKKKNLVLERVG